MYSEKGDSFLQCYHVRNEIDKNLALCTNLTIEIKLLN